MPSAQAVAASRVIPEFLHPAHGTPAPTTRAAVFTSVSAVAAGPIPLMPDPLARAIRATAAAMPDQGDDPQICLAAVCDAFQELNPIDTVEITLVSQFVTLGAAFLHLMRRTIDPDLPPALHERLTRTALAITRTHDRIFRLLRPENGVYLLAPRDQWAAWKDALLREEAARAEARKAAEAAREAAEAEAAEAVPSVPTPRSETARNDPMQSGGGRPAAHAAGPMAAVGQASPSRNLMQSGEDFALAAQRAGWPRDDRTGAAAGALFPPQAGEDLIAQAVKAAGAKANAAKEPHAP